MRSPPANQDSADGVWPPSATLLATVSKRSCISGLLSWSRVPAGRWAQQQIECDDVRDHQQGYVDDRDRIGAAQLPYDSRKDKDEPEESKTVQCSDCTLRRESIHNLEPGPNVDAEAKQPRDITENELNSEES